MKTISSQETGLRFSPASEVFTENEYISKVKLLVKKSILHDPTLVLHSDEEIQKKYNSSIVVIDTQSHGLIGNSSLYPTIFPSLKEIYNNTTGQIIKIGETGSSVIDPTYRNRGIGKQLIIEADLQLGTKYDAIIGATVNTIMRDMRINELGYEIAPFPSDLYEEGKIHLAPRMLGGIKEFEEKATCIIKFRLENIRKQVFEALNY